MLKKLLKYDLKKIYKILVIFYSLAIFFGILTRIFLNIDNSTIMYIIGQICSGVTISMFFNIIINNIMRLWSNFTINFYKDEGYLTNTLPVTRKQLYLSKFLSTIITMLTSIIIIIITLFIAYYSKENLQVLKEFLTSIATIYDSNIIKLLFIIFLVLFLELILMVQAGYNGIIIGHTKNNNKMGLSILYGFISYITAQVIILIFIFVMAVFNKDIMNLFISNSIPSIDTVKMVMYMAIIIYLVCSLIYYLINVKIFNKGINLD